VSWSSGITRSCANSFRGSAGWRWTPRATGSSRPSDGPTRAVRCAQAIIEAVRSLGIEVRAGVHTGEVESIDRKAGGVAVVVGARTGAQAAASEVLVSQTVRDLVAGSGLLFEDAGEHELKGIPDRWHLYRVVTEGA
jgi:class 3 adenylate cyclase